ncbi:TolC family protein [Porticoccus sp.]
MAQTHVEIQMEEAIERTLSGNPQLIAAGYQVLAQEGRVMQSRVRPSAELGLSVENVLGSGEYDVGDGAETTLNLAWVLERGKRERYIDAARAGVSVVESQVEIQRLDTVARTARLFLDNLEYQERVRLSQQAVALAQETVALVDKRVRAGRAATADLARAEAERARVRLIALDMKDQLATAQRKLAAQWGESQPGFQRVSGPWQQLPRPESLAALLERVDSSPNMATYLSRQRLREAELRLAQIQNKPDWRMNLGIRRLELSDDHAFVAGVTIPLAPGDSNRGHLAEARANLAQVDAERQATRLQIETQLFALYRSLEYSLHRSEALREDVLPRLQAAAAQTKQGYEAGRYSYYELQQLQAQLLLTQAELVEASVDAHRQLIEIERLTGTVMPSAVQ